MILERIQLKSWVLLGAAAVALAAALTGCSTPAVGAPCLPEQVPDDGFDDSEAYVESSSVQCETRVCIVFHLRGDPRDGCVDRPATNADQAAEGEDGGGGVVCADDSEIEKRVYCTCRCDSDSGFSECECPDGFSCVRVLEQGGPGVRGSYCVRNGTFTAGG